MVQSVWVNHNGEIFMDFSMASSVTYSSKDTDEKKRIQAILDDKIWNLVEKGSLDWNGLEYAVFSSILLLFVHEERGA